MSYEIFSGRFIMQWNFGLHNDLIMAKKMTFFRIFFLLHIFTSRRNFFVFIKISYLHGGTRKKALRQRRRRTNERLTIIIPRQDSQNPRANNLYDLNIISITQHAFIRCRTCLDVALLN